MIIYFIILGLFSLFVYLGTKYKMTPNVFMLWAGLGIILFSGLRYGVGIDFIAYWKLYSWININSLEHTEVGFKYLCKFLTLLGFGPQVMIIVMSTVTIVYAYKASMYYARNYIVIVVFAFLFAGFYMESFNLVRQYLAISLFFYASKYIIEKCFWKFLIYIILGALFHTSALMLIPFYWILKIDYKRWHLALILLSGVAGGSIISINNIFQLIPYYGEVYLILEADMNSSPNLGFGFFSKLLIALLAILFYNQIITKFSHYKLVVASFVYYVSLMAFFREYIVFLRFSYYFHIFLIVLFPAFVAIVTDKSKYIIYAVIFMYCMLLCYVSISDSEAYCVPYKFNIDIFTFTQPQR